MIISEKAVSRFAARMQKIRTKASTEILEYLDKTNFVDYVANHVLHEYELDYFIDHAYGIITKYGEAAGALSAEMYDALAELSGKTLPPAVPAPTPKYGEVSKTIKGTLKQSRRPSMIADAVGRQVKKVGVDTTLKNAARDGAQAAWVPQGDTCAFCIMLASQGWQFVKDGNTVDHIHANCDCEYQVRFDSKTNIAGYDPGKYRKMYDSAEGDTWEEKLNSMRRDAYAENKDEINAQKRDAYEKRKELNGSAAEEIEV